MLLAAFAKEVYLPSRISVSAEYANDLLAVCRRFSESLGHEATIEGMTEVAISAYLVAYRKSHTARSTNNQRQMLLMLWSAAYDHGLVDRPPRQRLIRILPLDHQPPQAWTIEHVAILLRHCDGLTGEVCGIPEHLYASALLQTIYWTGSRIGAMLKTPTACYRPGAGLTIPTPKNKQGQWFTLPPTCCAAIDATEPGTRDMLFPWSLHRTTLCKRMRQLVEAAGLEAPKIGKQLFHRLRRTTLSYCAAADPGIAQRTAGHSDYATTLKHYIDPQIANQRSAADVLPNPLSSNRPHFKIVG